jgi:hypothetical protein
MSPNPVASTAAGLAVPVLETGTTGAGLPSPGLDRAGAAKYHDHVRGNKR